MSYIATTIEQSRKLIELGLSLDSADMVWTTANPDLPMLLAYPIEDCNNWNDKVPAWSLSALLEVMPKGTELVKMQNDAHELYYEVDYMFTGYEDSDPITAAYEMVCWLLEQGFIEK